MPLYTFTRFKQPSKPIDTHFTRFILYIYIIENYYRDIRGVNIIYNKNKSPIGDTIIPHSSFLIPHSYKLLTFNKFSIEKTA